MLIDILTIFPVFFQSPLEEGLLKIAQEKGLLEVETTDIRDFALNKHRQVDDYSYGGGPGMVMKPEPIFAAIESVLGENQDSWKKQARLILLTPRGKKFDQRLACELANEDHIAFICGHYEGIDERICEIVTDEVSIGDYVLSGGEAAALVMLDSIVRLIAGVVGSAESLNEESFKQGLLEYPQYTRPKEFMNMVVPDVLTSGDHGKIRKWRRRQSIRKTYLTRPELLKYAGLDEEERLFLKELRKEKIKESNKDEQD